jgi:hypothetical protein
MRRSLKIERMLRALWEVTMVVWLALGCGSLALACKPLVDISVGQLDFATQAAGTESKDLVISPIGPANAMISSIKIAEGTSTNFTQTNTYPISPHMLATNTRCEVHVIFQPRNTGELICEAKH